MTKNFVAIKTSAITILLLVSVFTAFSIISPESNSAEAAIIPKFVQYDSIIELSFEDSSVLNTPIHPLGGTRNIDINVRYRNTVPEQFREGLGKNLMFGFFKFVFLAPVHLEVENVPEWCTATVSPSDLIFDAFADGDELETTVTLQVAVNKESTALFPKTLRLKATGESPDPHIKAPPQVTLDVGITPGYVPLISTNAGAPIKKTNPNEPVSWDIQITNNGNGEALVKARVLNPPEGWVVSVNPQMIVPSLAEAEDNKEILTLTALPPKNFGYYNDQVQIELELIPEFSSPGAGSASNITRGEPLYLTLGIENRGFSTGTGLELGLIVVVILAIISIIVYLKKFRS